MAESDYGSTITKGGQAVGKCIVIDFPEIGGEKINTTNHASGGWSEGIPSGLLNVGDITLMVLLEPGVLDGITDEMLAKTVDEVIIANEVDTLTFDGFYLSVKPEAADSQSPNAVRASVVISPTGPIVINTTS
jgi:hypothetical protein